MQPQLKDRRGDDGGQKRDGGRRHQDFGEVGECGVSAVCADPVRAASELFGSIGVIDVACTLHIIFIDCRSRPGI